MNQNLHRIVFNVKRGQRMAVAETVSAQGKSAAGEATFAGQLVLALAALTAALKPIAVAGTLAGTLALTLAASLAGSFAATTWFTAAQAQIIADPNAPGKQRPTVLNAGNGVPLVNIQTPSAAGVSRNTYSQFDVNRSGVILNNSRTNVQSQLGGFVPGNPWLANGPARIILNEVNAGNSGNVSQLNGYLEVAGQRAELIIANPAGINIDGAGFINASRVTLTTGTALFNSANGGSLDAWRVQGGVIGVNGAGLDARSADFTSILARAVQVNAGIWAADLKVITGANQINQINQIDPVEPAQASATATLGLGAAPAFALDIAQLGGMYAGKIFLLGTEAGVGVRNAGVIGASAGDLVLQTSGWLSNSGSIKAAGNTQISTAGALSNSGTLYASGKLRIAAQAGINNTGAVGAWGSTSLQATGAGAQISSAAGSLIAAGWDSDGHLAPAGALASAGSLNITAADSAWLNGRVASSGDAVVSGAELNLANSIFSAQNIQLAASLGDINASQSRIYLLEGLTASTRQTLRTDGASVIAKQLDLSASNLSNVGGQIVQLGTGNTTISLASPTGTLDNTAGRIASNGQNLSLTAQTLTNTDGKIEHAGSGRLALTATALNDQRGKITSNAGLVLDALSVNHDSASTVAEQISITAQTLTNHAGEILQIGMLGSQITASGRLDNSAGTIASNGNTKINAQSLNNQGGVVRAAGTAGLMLTTAELLDNSAGGLIAAGGDALLQAGRLSNSQGKLTAGAALDVAAIGAISNTQGLIAANGAVVLQAASLDNSQGTIASVKNQLSASTTGLTRNDSGRIEAAGDVSLDNTGLSNTQAPGQSIAGSIVGRNIAIDTGGQNLNNAFGSIAARQGAVLKTGALNNNAGLIQAGAALSIDSHGQTLSNTNAAAYANGAGGISALGSMRLSTGDLDNTAGFLGAAGPLMAVAAGVTNTLAGQIVSESSINIASTAFDNRGGQLEALSDLTLSTDPNPNPNAGTGTGTGSLNNTGGLLRSAANITLFADSVINSNTLGQNLGIEGNNLAITANTLANHSGAIRADNNLVLAARNTVNNSAGLISAGNAITLQDSANPNAPAARTLAMTNTAGTLVAGQRTSIIAASLTGDGKLLSKGDLFIDLSSDFNNRAEVIANGNASVKTSGKFSNSGKLQAGNLLSLSALDIDNQATGEISASTTRISAENALTNRGLIDGQTTQIDAATLNNLGTGRIYGDSLSIAAASLFNHAETVGGVASAAVIAARQRLDIGASAVNNSDGGLIFSAGDMAIGGSLDAGRRAVGLAQAINNAGGTLEALDALSASAAQINNTNPRFAYDLMKGANGPSLREFVTAQGTWRSADGAWSLGGDTLTAASHGGYFYGRVGGFWAGGDGKARVIAPGSLYATAQYHAIYNSPDVVPLGGGSIVPPANTALWDYFGLAVPSLPPPDNLPGAYCPGRSCNGDNADATMVYPDPSLVAAWDTDAAPWTALQDRLNAFRSAVAATAITADGFRDYSQASYIPVVTQSAPGRILSGSTMTLNASGALLNHQSQIIAGGALNLTGQAADNRARVITVNAQRSGTAYFWSNYNEGCGNIFGCDYNYNAYRNAVYSQDVPQTMAINVALSQGLISPTSQGLGSGVKLAGALSADLSASNTNINSIGPVSAAARSSTIDQVTSSVATVGGGNGGKFPVVRTSALNLSTPSVPNASLFRTNPSPASHYLIETDPRFANYRNWLSSDYLLNALSLDPALTQKRLGDGFYEQRLIREQVALLTGQRFLGDYTSDEQSYQALMDSGLTFAREWQLRPGIALTPAQMAVLTSDIVWLVEQDVSLPGINGQPASQTKVLVPRVYVRVQPGDLDGAGTLLAGRELTVNLTGDLTNSGTLAGRKIVSLTAENLQNLGGRITGNDLSVSARSDLNNIGGQIDATDRLSAVAGRDLNLITTTSSASNQTGGTSTNRFSLTGIDRVAGLYVSGNPASILSNPGAPAGSVPANLSVSAGRDITLTAGVISNAGVNSQTTLSAGNNLNLGTVSTASRAAQSRDADDFLRDSQSKDIGSQIQTAGSLSLKAGADLNAKAANIEAGGNLSATAGNNVNLTAGQQTGSFGFGLTTSQSDLFSGSSSKERRTSAQTQSLGSSLSGNTLSLAAGKDIRLQGANVISDSNASLAAGNNLKLEAAEGSSSSSSFFEKKESGC